MDKRTFITPETLIIAGMMGKDFENVIPYLLQQSRQFLLDEGFIQDDVEDLIVEIQQHHIGGYDFPFGDQADSVMQLVNAIGEWEHAKYLNDHRLISNAVHKIISFGLAASGFIHEVTSESVEGMKSKIDSEIINRKKGGTKTAEKKRTRRDLGIELAKEAIKHYPKKNKSEIADYLILQMKKRYKDFGMKKDSAIPSKSTVERHWLSGLFK